MIDSGYDGGRKPLDANPQLPTFAHTRSPVTAIVRSRFARILAWLARIVFFWREEPRCGNCRYFDRAAFVATVSPIFAQAMAVISPDQLLNQKRGRRDPETMAVLDDTPDDVSLALKGRMHTWDRYGACGMKNAGVFEGFLCEQYRRGRNSTE